MLPRSTSDFSLQHVHDLQSGAELAASLGFWSLDLVSGEQYCSPGLCHLLGIAPAPLERGVAPWQAALPPAGQQAAAADIAAAIETRKPLRADYQTALPDGRMRWIAVRGQAEHDASGRALRLSGYCLDVTDRKRVEAEYQGIKERQSFLLMLSDALAPLSDPVQMQVEACRVLGQYLQVNRVFYAEADEDGLNRAGPQYVDGVPPTGEVWHSNDFDPSLIVQYQSGGVLTCDDVTRNASLTEEQKDAYAADQIVAWAAAPIAKQGLPVGRLVIHQNKPRQWTPSEIALIKETAERVWPAVQRAKSQAALELTENIPVGTYTMVLTPGSEAAAFSFLSRRFLEITGLKAEEVRNDVLRAFDCIHPDDRLAWREKHSEAWSKRAPFLGEARVISHGETRWIRAETSTRHMPDGSTVWEGVLIDITDQRRAEEALQESEERYRLVAEITQEAWWEEDVDAQRIYNSARLSELLHRGAELLSCSPDDYRALIHPADRAQTRAAYERAIHKNADYREIYRLRRADDRYIWVEDRARVVHRDAQGRAKRVLGAVTDITARKEAEIALAESARTFRHLFDEAPDAYVITSMEGRFLACNKAAERMLRGPADQIIGTTPFDLSPPLQPDGRDSHESGRELIRSVIEKGYNRFEWLHRRLDGTDFWVEVTLTVGPFQHQTVIYAIWREIGDIIAAKQAAEAASIAKSQFLSVMSHELRTPLSAIMGMFQLIEINGVSEKVRDYVTRGLKNSEHLLRLVEDILDFSSIEAGRLALIARPFRLGTLLNEVSDASAIWRKAGVAFSTRADQGILDLELSADSLRLKQVLINLLGNAFKFTDRGSVTLSVTSLEAGQQTRVLEFTVEDTGIGMTAEQKNRLFQPFTQVDMSDTRRFGGTGLGLVISERLVSLLGGGPITVESRPGVGSRFAFRVTLPLAGQPLPRPPASLPDAGRRTRRLEGQRILVVEDVETIRLAVRLLLESEGAVVDEAGDGDEGVKKALAAALPHDMVLMDMQLPVKDGIEATRELRRHGYAQPIVALTANAFAQDVENCLAAGMTGYISKPVKIDAMVEMLQRSRRS